MGTIVQAQVQMPTPMLTSSCVVGICHVCRDRGPAEFRTDCGGHWICLKCLGRGLRFVMGHLQGPGLDCCGPIASLP